jgi:hypothetical protein
MKSKIYLGFIFVCLFAAAIAVSIAARQSQQKEKPDQTDHDHMSGVNKRGDQAMGFDHEKTTHHFLLKSDGGVIQVTANDSKDTASRDQIRMHLRHIAMLFSQGNFDIPMFVHDRTPPGVPVMKQLKDSITYRYDEIDNGARVIIHSSSSDAVTAIHDFLRFQIEDHKTGDPTVVGK